MIRVVELFAGIGAQASALERLGIDHKRVAVCEWDEHTYRVYCAIHGETPNLGDITKVEHLPECDLLTYSSPCQDISVAGHMLGLAKGSGTRSAVVDVLVDIFRGIYIDQDFGKCEKRPRIEDFYKEVSEEIKTPKKIESLRECY